MIFLAFLVWVLAIILSSVAVQHLMASTARHKVVTVLLAPGLIVHEVSHVLACLVTGATVTEVSLSNAGAAGKVKHTRPAIPVLGQVLIALAPLIGCGLVLWLITFGILRPVSQNFSIDRTPPQALMPLDAFAKYLIDVLSGTWRSVTSADFSDWRTYAFLYLALVLVMHMAPSKRDLGSAVASILLVGVALFVAERLGWRGLVRPVQAVWPFLTLCLALGVFVLAAVLVVAGVVKLVRLLLRPAG